jgi:beta-glucosidase
MDLHESSTDSFVARAAYSLRNRYGGLTLRGSSLLVFGEVVRGARSSGTAVRYPRRYATNQLAVAAACKAKVAIVFVGDYHQEGTDGENLSLPGVANALISAVAAVNKHTIVVLNTRGAVYMPWLSHESAVLETRYPGKEYGAAIAAVLTGRVNPSGHLPIAFPASTSTTPVTKTSQFPDVNSVVDFGTGLDISYRWY